MNSISLDIKNQTADFRTEEPVTVGVPLPKGEISGSDLLVLKDETGEIPAQFTPLAQWPDGSLKWVLLDFQPVVDKKSTYTCFLEKSTGTTNKDALQGVQVEDQGQTLLVNTGSSTFVVDKQHLFPFAAVQTNTTNLLQEEASGIVLKDKDNTPFIPEITEISVELSGALRTTIKAEGSFNSGQEELLNFISRIHFFKKKSFVKIDFTLWNKGPAKHVGGLWDLGDPGSVLFKELFLKFVISDEIVHEKRLRSEQGKNFEKINAQDITLYQDSSGGENWQSTNHINRDQQIPVSFRGYKVYQKEEILSEGLRATPILHVGDEAKGISATVRHFWQNFPKALSAKEDEITIHLFPGQFADLYELQGGEKKTHSIFLDFGGSPNALAFADQPLQCTLPRAWYAQTETIPYLSKTGVTDDLPYDDLLESAVAGDKSFFSKREIIDEYGWRNFGEIYADHEAVGHKGKTPLISHYNNQYDQVYGFFREYIASGNGSWFELMDDLARHVRDIDIYATRGDRNEYNNGLHWHTNHYLDAATCTHRSVSKGHLDKYDPQFYGGGPGMEHCYGSGFMYHYFMTGDTASEDALLTLADWVCHCIGDADTILGTAYKIKSLLPQWKQALTGEKIRADRYPLTRGSGNPLSVLLDAFVLSSDKVYLHKAEEIVKGCIHPVDDIESRDLLDAENGWSYNVCLQAIGKYLDVKLSINELDSVYAYARESLLHYAKWMLEHEYPYLEKIEILEFPNETWPAQDLRKSCVFYFAAKHSSEELKGRFLEKGEYYHHYVINKLNEFETRSLARPIALLMQNRWMHAYFSEHPDDTAPPLTGKYNFSRSNEFWTRSSMVKNIASSFVYALKNTSIAKERYWLRCRKGEHV